MLKKPARTPRIAHGAVFLAAALVLAACASKPSLLDSDPGRLVRDKNASPRVRLEAAREAMQRAGSDELSLRATQDSLDEVLWNFSDAPRLRASLVQDLLNHPDPRVVERTRATVRDLLPREPSLEIIAMVCDVAAGRKWDGMIPAMVRSYARPTLGPETPADAQRAERLAIQRLVPGKSPEDVVFEQFIASQEREPTAGLDWTGKVQRDAWDLLRRLEPTGGALRQRVLSKDADARATPRGAAALAALRTGLEDLRVFPETGEELAWLARATDAKDKRISGWRADATTAVAQLPEGAMVATRDLEPMRWASKHRPAWSGMSRDAMMGEIRSRLKGREMRSRGGSEGVKYSELLDRHAGELSWGDCAAILILDESLRRPGVLDKLNQQARLDLDDSKTEYGGVFEMTGADSVWPVPVLHPPRAAQRQGDLRYVASEEMIEQSTMALAQFHFHAQVERNLDYAGPSAGDLAFADRFGRHCLVLTTVGKGRLNVDYYRRGGVVVDMGTYPVTAEGVSRAAGR